MALCQYLISHFAKIPDLGLERQGADEMEAEEHHLGELMLFFVVRRGIYAIAAKQPRHAQCEMFSCHNSM